MAADVTAHVMHAELALDELHGGEDRAFRAPGAERRRARMDVVAHDRERLLDARLVVLAVNAVGRRGWALRVGPVETIRGEHYLVVVATHGYTHVSVMQ